MTKDWLPLFPGSAASIMMPQPERKDSLCIETNMSSSSSSSLSPVAEKDDPSAGSNKEEQEQPLPDAEPGPSNAASSSNAGHGDIPNPPRIPDVVRLGDTNAFLDR